MNGIIFTVFFFFSSRRRHTRCSRDWSSDVCSSDLARPEGAELERVIVGRLLLVAQGFVNRKLEDEVGLRMAAVREGCTYLEARMRLLEFLDADAASLTPPRCDEFRRPRIPQSDSDLDTHAMRIVLR